MSVAEKYEADTYDKWREFVTNVGTNPYNWQHAGDWFFPTPKNRWPINVGKFYHICPANWRLDMAKKESAKPCTERCEACGEVIPDGIKMIAALLTW